MNGMVTRLGVAGLLIGLATQATLEAQTRPLVAPKPAKQTPPVAAPKAAKKAPSRVRVNDKARMQALVIEGERLLKTRQATPIAELQKGLNRPVCQVEFIPPATEELEPAELYRRARQSVVIISSLYYCNRCTLLHSTVAGGVVVGKSGEVLTNEHVVRGRPDQKRETMVAMTAEGQVIPVRKVLASSRRHDVAIIKLDATGLPALPLGKNPLPGSPIRVLGHPNNHFFHFSDGIISRYFPEQGPKGRTEVMSITADFGRGSSGGPILDLAGNVVGIVSRTSSLYYRQTKDKQENLQMVFKLCVASSSIRTLIGKPNPVVALKDLGASISRRRPQTNRTDEPTLSDVAVPRDTSSAKPGEVIGIRLSHNKKITDAGLVHLKELTKLQTLDLSYSTNFTDAGLVHLKELTALQTLKLGNTKITDAGLGHLKGLTNLQTLDPPKQITDAGLAHLKELDKLQHLSLYQTKITDAGLVHLKGLTNLQTLNLHGTKVTDAGLGHLKGLTNLQSLSLSGSQTTDAGLVHLEGLTDLRNLSLTKTTFTGVGLASLKGLTKLQHLRLERTEITDAGLVHLDGLTNLQSLRLYETKVNDAELVHLNGLTKLQTLDLTGNQITDAGLVHLKELAELQYLFLGGTKITGAGLMHLKGLPKLRHLSLDRTRVTDAGLMHLKGLTNLQQLSLRGTKITGVGLVHLRGLTRLQSLGLDRTQTTDVGLVHLKGLTKLSILGLRNTKVTSAGIANLTKSLPECWIPGLYSPRGLVEESSSDSSKPK